MKNQLAKGMAVVLIQIAIILSLGGRMLYDRAHYPRAWVQATLVDPDLPIRGRYVTLQLRVQAPWFKPVQWYGGENVRLAVENNQLVVFKSDVPTGVTISPASGPNPDSWLLQPVAFFIPEHAVVPFPIGQELWVEVTVPPQGPPRPIQLAVKRGTEWHPLNLR